ncbi:HNH endonuclease [Mesorhizobium sp. BHbsci]
MGFEDIDRNAVLRAIEEYDQLGRPNFLKHYGFGKARSYVLEHEGKPYDSKAIVGVAHRYARPDLGPLKASDFSGGDATVRKKLEQLGFQVIGRSGDTTSQGLQIGGVYTRDRLRQMFGIVDATLNTGVFRPKGTRSVWLFITAEKTADRTQYHDSLVGDVLHWQGQTSGRTDALIIDHQANGLELLVFYRQRKYEFDGAGFRYLGPFNYVSHSSSSPTSFILHRANQGHSAIIPPEESDPDVFDPDNVQDARKKIARTIAQRRGQQSFRDALLSAYEGSCAISGCTVVDVLEAVHIVPYKGDATNVVSNGLLLRSDLHTLFDCGLIWIDTKKMTVQIAGALVKTEYEELRGRTLRVPKSAALVPSIKALDKHRNESTQDEASA